MKNSLENFSHHAYLIGGELASAKTFALQYLRERGIETAGNPDVIIFETDELGIDDTRKIINEEHIAPVALDKKIVILIFSRARKEALQSLLKILEEPKTSIFFMVTPSAGMLPLTILSRVEKIASPSDVDAHAHDAFFKKSADERLALLADMPFFDDSLEPSQKRVEAAKFLSSVESYLHGYPLEAKKKVAWARAVKNVLNAKKEVLDAVAPYKSLIERIVITLPERK